MGEGKMRFLISLLFVACSVASAAKLEDVKLLGAKAGADNFELKLQLKDGPPNSFFYIDIVKTDPDAFAKMIHVANKLMQKERYRLDMDIISFSASPSGSYYKSKDIIFRGGPAGRNLGSVNDAGLTGEKPTPPLK
jgi:hypothetical protein